MNQGIPVQETPREIKTLARSALSTVLWSALICYFIYQFATSYLPSLIANTIPSLSQTYTIEYMGLEYGVKYSYLPLVFIVVLYGPFRLSLSKIYLKIIRERNVEIPDIFWGFRFFLNAFVVWLLIIICVAVGMIPIAAVTGLVAALLMGAGGFLQSVGAGITSIGMFAAIILGLLFYMLLAMSFYVIADNPKTKPIAALRASLGIMKPNLFRIIILRISYFGWLFVAVVMSASLTGALSGILPETSFIITIISGLPMIFVAVYMDMGEAFFYEFAIGHLRKTAPSHMVNTAPPSGFGY